MAVDSRRVPPLPPSPLSQPIHTVDPARVRLSWLTLLYMAIASALPRLLTDLVLYGSPLAWLARAAGLSAAQGAVLGLTLVAADRLAPNRSRVFRWTAGPALAVLLAYGVGMTWTAVSPGGLQTPGAQMAFLVYAVSAVAWVLLGVGWGLAATSLASTWWKLPAVGAAVYIISVALRLAVGWLLVQPGQAAPAAPMHLALDVVSYALLGALLGLAVAAGLDRGRRSIEASKW